MSTRSDFHYVPTAVDLVEAVRDFLIDEVAPGAEGPLRYNCRIAVRLLDTVARELTRDQDGPESVVALHGARLLALGHADDAELAAAVRAGRHDDELLTVLDLLAPAARERVEVANPAYLKDEVTT
jgi:hypothetical protein